MKSACRLAPMMPFGIDHPVEDQRADQRRDDHRQQREEDHRPLEEAWQAVDRQRDEKAQQHGERRDDEAVGQREGQGAIERQRVDTRHRHRATPLLSGKDRLPSSADREMCAVEIGAQPVELAQRFLARSARRSLRHRHGCPCVQPKGPQLSTVTITLSCSTNSDWTATETTGSAMNSSIASGEGRMNQKNVYVSRCGRRRLETLDLGSDWGTKSRAQPWGRPLAALVERRLAQEAAFFGSSVVGGADVAERLRSVLGALEEIADFVARSAVCSRPI